MEAWNKHPIRTERNWNPEQIWTNGMIDRVIGRLPAVADVRGDAHNYCVDYEWYGFDPDKPPPPDDGLSTVEVNDVSLDVPDEVINRFTNDVDPLEHSSVFAIDIFQRGVAFLENLWGRQKSVECKKENS